MYKMGRGKGRRYGRLRWRKGRRVVKGRDNYKFSVRGKAHLGCILHSSQLLHYLNAVQAG